LIAACAAVEGLQHDVLGHFLAPASTIVIASSVPHMQVEIGLLHLRHQRVDEICPSIRPMRTAPTGPRRQRRDCQRGGRAVDREGVMAVLAVDSRAPCR